MFTRVCDLLRYKDTLRLQCMCVCVCVRVCVRVRVCVCAYVCDTRPPHSSPLHRDCRFQGNLVLMVYRSHCPVVGLDVCCSRPLSSSWWRKLCLPGICFGLFRNVFMLSVFESSVVLRFGLNRSHLVSSFIPLSCRHFFSTVLEGRAGGKMFCIVLVRLCGGLNLTLRSTPWNNELLHNANFIRLVRKIAKSYC
jgi:hypothetical protein